MSENLTSNNIDNDGFNQDSEEIEYKNLIIRLKDISKNILLLKKQYLDKFNIFD